MADEESKPKAGVKGLFIVLVLSVLVIIFAVELTKPAPNLQAVEDRLAANDALIASTEAELGLLPDAAKGWVYESEVDPMTDKATRTGCVLSEEQVRLDSPYDDVFARLCLRDSPAHGKDVLVQLVGDGQILCRSYDGCTLKVRFDKGPIQSFSGAGAADYSSNVVFFENRSRFEGAMLKADTTIVELELYQAGSQPVTFKTAGFAWPK